MKSKIEISVIVTVYNLEQYIEECLDSILSQKGINFEVICVDDASTDSSYEILCKYMSQDSRIRVIKNEKNRGLSSSRNIGFRAAKGEYLYNIDGDDILVEDALKTMYAYAQKNDLDLLGFSAEAFFENDTFRQYGSADDYIRKKYCSIISKGVDLFTALYENEEPVTSNMCLYCIRNDFIKDNDLYDIEGLRYVDDSMFLKYMKANRVMCVSDVLYRRRYRNGSMVVSPMKRIYLECMIVLFVNEFSYWQQMELTEHENEVISKYFLRRMQEIDSMSYAFSDDKSEMEYLSKYPGAKLFYNCILNKKLLYEDRITAEEKEKLLNANNLIIYGAGYFAEKVTDILEFYNKSNYTVVVSGDVEDEYFRGHRVYSALRVPHMFKDAVVIVAVSRKHKKEISGILNKCEALDVIWFD